MASRVAVRSYCSSSGVVLLAFHWKPPANKPFFGFSIKRTPGFYDPNSGLQVAFNWLPNRLNFFGPLDEDAPSNIAPIQKFMWWDARFHPLKDAGKKFVYEVTPMTGTANALSPFPNASTKITLTFPARNHGDVATWFNRPLVSSQAFSRLMQRYGVDPKAKLSSLGPEQREAILTWLSNHLEDGIADVLKSAGAVDGAVYHFTDTQWLEPQFKTRKKKNTSLVLHWKLEGQKGKKELANKSFATKLASNVTFFKREKVPSLMHDKILVLSSKSGPQKVLMGSANFTTGAMTTQANVLHVWSTPKLAKVYFDRVKLLQEDRPKTKKNPMPAEWSPPIPLKGGGTVRAFFPPEPGSKEKNGSGKSIEPIVEAIKQAKSSVLFCFFSSTDDGVRNACIAASKRGLMMYGLVNQISKNEPRDIPQNRAKIELFKYTKKSTEIVGAASLLSNVPEGWMKEIFTLGAGDKAVAKIVTGKKNKAPPPEVHIHHKFILIDGETKNPVLYTGSANISSNSAYSNDENLLEIRGARALSETYLAEFMRLYEHYRFRFVSDRQAKTKSSIKGKPLRLDGTGKKWFGPYFKQGTPQQRAAKRLAT